VHGNAFVLTLCDRTSQHTVFTDGSVAGPSRTDRTDPTHLGFCAGEEG
jgi:hypothetical protein